MARYCRLLRVAVNGGVVLSMLFSSLPALSLAAAPAVGKSASAGTHALGMDRPSPLPDVAPASSLLNSRVGGDPEAGLLEVPLLDRLQPPNAGAAASKAPTEVASGREAAAPVRAFVPAALPVSITFNPGAHLVSPNPDQSSPGALEGRHRSPSGEDTGVEASQAYGEAGSPLSQPAGLSLLPIWQEPAHTIRPLTASYNGTRHLYSNRSTDGGLTWSAPVTLSVESTSTGYDSSQPALALDAAGTLHLVWAEEADIGNCTDCDHIYYRTSTDAGQSWSGATRLNNWTPTDFDRSVQPDVAVADNGDVAAVWRRAPGDSGPGDIYLRRRVGGTWQSPQMISEGDGQAGWPRIAVGEDGSLHIAWHYDAGSHDEIHYRSWDGSAWDTIVSISGEVRAVNHSGATDDPDHDIAVNRAGQVFVAWITEIYDTALATRSGTSWSPPQILVEHLGSIHLSLATDEMGAPQVIQSKADIGTTVYHITSGASSDITKHYYANGQRIATQVDGVLYYVLGDAGGQSALFADSTGQEVGHIWYDPLGGVIQNTLPATLTEKLAGHLDTATGLQYHGARYYDPSVGSFLQPDPFGGVPQAPQSLNRFAFSVDDLAPISTSPGRTSYPRATATAVNLGFLAEARWWVQQGVSQGITYGTTQRLAEYSLIRLSVSASRHRLLTRLPERAIEVLGGRSVVETLPANRSLHTLSTGGIKILRGQALERSAFDEFTENAGRWTGRVGDDYLSHSLSWMGSRWFGASLAGAGDLAIQWLWPGTGDAWNRDNYGLTPEQFIGRGAVAAGGGLLAWGTVELTTATLVAGGVIAAPAEMPFIAGALIFVGVEFVYEWQIKPHLYEWLDLKGINEP